MLLREWSGRTFLIMFLVIFVLYPWSAFSQICPEDCQCISEAKAKEMFGEGNYQMCQKTPCGKEESSPGVTISKFCIKACPKGCSCLTQEEAKQLGYQPCSDQMVSCGIDLKGIPMYCFTPALICPPGCRCLTEAEAKELGYNELCQNQRIECGRGDAKYCFKVPAPACPTGCTCLSKEEAKAKGLTDVCRDDTGNAITCEVIDKDKGVFKYCFKLPVQRPCRYDYEQGNCVGSCPQGERCQLNSIQRDPKTGKVIFAECHCK